MADSWKSEKKPGRDRQLRTRGAARPAGGRLSPGRAVLLSTLSWPVRDCPAALKPVMVLVAGAFWLALAAAATRIAPPPGAWPILPVAAVFLLAGFVGGSIIAMLAAGAYCLLLYFGVLALNLPDTSREMLASGYRHRDVIMLLVFTWICGVPHWRRNYSSLFTLLWGLVVVFAPVLFILLSIYVFRGYLPEPVVERLLNRDFLLAWGVSVAVAAILAKVLYLLKDYLQRVRV